MRIIEEKDIEFECIHEINQKKIDLLNKTLISEEGVKMKIIEDEDNILVLFFNPSSQIIVLDNDDVITESEYGNLFSFIYVTNHNCWIDNETCVDINDIREIKIE